MNINVHTTNNYFPLEHNKATIYADGNNDLGCVQAAQNCGGV
jgi:hypothetical protein